MSTEDVKNPQTERDANLLNRLGINSRLDDAKQDDHGHCGHAHGGAGPAVFKQTCAGLGEHERIVAADQGLAAVLGQAARALQRCASRVLIIVPNRNVAAWARRLVRDWPDERVQFIVLGPDDIPRITDPITARADPSLAVLSAAMHADGPNGAAVMRAAAAAAAAAA